MATNNRSDIAIETAEAIDALLADADRDWPEDTLAGLLRARHVIATFIAATRVSQGPRIGRPRKPKAEPAPAHWANVLGVKLGARREDVEAAYRRLAATRHPDKGGSAEAMAELDLARERALRECQA
jgi:DnaJ-domain-containing protein 1